VEETRYEKLERLLAAALNVTPDELRRLSQPNTCRRCRRFVNRARTGAGTASRRRALGSSDSVTSLDQVEVIKGIRRSSYFQGILIR
jgi:hypothetical protein